MSQRTLDKPDSISRSHGARGRSAAAGAATRGDIDPGRAAPVDAAHVADLLERMTLKERIAAYRTGEISRRELTIAAAREPDRMPIRNGEFEWIALSLADLE